MHNEEFPVKIELGRKESDMAMPAPYGPKKRGKPRTYYPTLYVDNMPGLEAIGKEGVALINFRRKRLSIEEDADGKESAGVTLEVRSIQLPEGGESEPLEDSMRKFMDGEGESEEEEGEDE